MPSPVRYPSGVTNVKSGDACRMLPRPSSTRIRYWFEDFDHYVETQGGWYGVSEKATGTISKTAGDGGLVTIICSSTSEAESQLYYNQSSWALESGRRSWFGVRAKFTGLAGNYISMETFIGFQTLTSTGGTSTTVAERIGFFGVSSDANIDFVIGTAGARAGEALSIGGGMDGAFHTYEWEFDGVDEFTYYVDGVKKGSVTTSTFPTNALSPCAIIAPTKTSEHTGASLVIDWIYAAKERVTVNT